MPSRYAGSPCRRTLKRGAPKLATLRCAQTDAAPYPLQGPSTRRHTRGLHVKSKGKGKGKCNGKGNGNGKGILAQPALSDSP